MFKKTLILASLTTFVMSGCVFAAPQEPDFGPPPPAGKEMSCPFKKPPMCMKHKKPDCTCKNKCDKKDPRAEFENRLKLTDEQKAKAKEIRLNGHKEMKPIMEKLKAKHQEAESIRNSKLDESAKQEKLAKRNETQGQEQEEQEEHVYVWSASHDYGGRQGCLSQSGRSLECGAKGGNGKTVEEDPGIENRR